MELQADNFPEAFHETMWQIRISGKPENSRNGPVVTIQEPFLLTVLRPWERVVTCPVRDANPFFHVMETVWMFAGQRNVTWLKQFNSRIYQYADDGVIHGAYGHRWLKLWGDQVARTIHTLRVNPESRQAVIQMWDPMSDWQPHWKDRPCNTQIMFRCVNGALDMTLINRSNDVIYGMFGANCVHMSYLHEFLARAVGMLQGKYRVMTNNLHFYRELYPNGDNLFHNIVPHSIYPAKNFPILSLADSWEKMHHECTAFVSGFQDKLTVPWLTKVAKPMHDCYLAKNPGARIAHASLVEDEAWRTAALQWLERRYDEASIQSLNGV